MPWPASTGGLGSPMRDHYLDEIPVITHVAQMMEQCGDNDEDVVGGGGPSGGTGTGAAVVPDNTGGPGSDTCSATVWYTVNQSELHGDWVLKRGNVRACDKTLGFRA